MLPVRRTYRRVQPGDHVRAHRLVYKHHGIYEGFGQVISWHGDGVIRRAPLEDFHQGEPYAVIEYATCFHPELVVARARSMLGRDERKNLGSNCEHFARWCKTGHHHSEMVRGFTAAAAAVAATSAMTAGAIGLGLAPTGGVMGLGALAVAPAFVASRAIHEFLPDDPYLDARERNARGNGRTAGVLGGAAGTAAALATVAAVGTPGLTAAGVASGLATMGALIGGGTKTGLAMAVCMPVVGAAALACICYLSSRPPEVNQIPVFHPPAR